MVGIILMHSRQEVVHHKICDFATEALTGGEVGAEMHSGENSTQGCFLVGLREAVEGTLYTRQNFGSNGEIEMIATEKRFQH